jgi:predicted lipid carrier protein YhbT
MQKTALIDRPIKIISGRFFRWEVNDFPLRKAFTLPATRETGILFQHFLFAAAF